MKVAKRRQLILDLIHSGNTNVETLCGHLGVSEATVRRDLTALAEQGLIMRIYGGAAHIGTREPEASLQERSGHFSSDKARIARAALAHIEDHDTILLDGGTSTAALAKLLGQRRGLHVITNNLLAATALGELPEGRVTLLGGDLRSSSMATFGPAAMAVLERLTADKVFVSADGVVAGRGLCEASAGQSYLKERMIQQAAAVFILADASKLGRDRQQYWTPLNTPWTLITYRASADLLAPFEADPWSHVEQAG
ncbi:DeoR/GlpR family DNA-binding transcription regulator [Phytopseudomonas dryadis]|uniref:DeoR family transcriptional regulator n=1 Tax=Phytopseudomonas dryadis TaxID=2487520 RepID=A0A4Q9R3Y3_9GAMM|nr:MULTISPECIES: DeoR/GlpR family DNA-binding transcription regulator [Pseudomonas]TBU92805.1 DeoR family transcriptional regulator [Pseudomonas dryadis]TBV03329.1 DeoR family transcriptional regulator [Pseudomonas dryadis]TBV16406.1 DeoR family transcriptional regulator [Pseudomonas sp. FRB 230]